MSAISRIDCLRAALRTRTHSPLRHDGRQPVGRWNDGPDVEERYIVAPSGAVEVTLTTRPAGFKRTFRLERRASARL